LNFARKELFHQFVSVVRCALKTFNQKTCEWYLAEQIACNICKPYASLDLVKIDANTFNLRGRLREVIYWFLQCNSRVTFWLKIFLSERTLYACVAVIFRHGYWRRLSDPDQSWSGRSDWITKK
jgi:hypothetical protein